MRQKYSISATLKKVYWLHTWDCLTYSFPFGTNRLKSRIFFQINLNSFSKVSKVKK